MGPVGMEIVKRLSPHYGHRPPRGVLFTCVRLVKCHGVDPVLKALDVMLAKDGTTDPVRSPAAFLEAVLDGERILAAHRRSPEELRREASERQRAAIYGHEGTHQQRDRPGQARAL